VLGDGSNIILIVLATDQGNPPDVRVWTVKMCWFSCSAVQKPNPVALGGPNLDPDPSTNRFSLVWLAPPVPISGSEFHIFLFVLAFLYPTVNCKILTKVWHCHFLMYSQPLYRKQVERRSLPHSENERQWSVNNGWSCILGNLSGA